MRWTKRQIPGRHTSARAAFTLIELLIVITIIAALVTLSFPATNAIIARSRAAHCIGNLRNIGAALNLYLADHNNTMPTLVTARESSNDDEPAVETVLLEYVGGSAEVFHCKGDTKKLFETTGSSYLWNSLLNGQNTSSLDFMGLIKTSAGIPVVSDKESFHKYRSPQVNILYADGHVAKEIQFRLGGK